MRRVFSILESEACVFLFFGIDAMYNGCGTIKRNYRWTERGCIEKISRSRGAH